MKSKVLTLTLALCLIASTQLTAHATDINLSEGTQTATTPSAFNVTDDLVADGVTVKIPASLDLTYNENMGTFHVADKVTAYGDLVNTSELIVSVDENITYKLADSEETLNGFVRFGSIQNGIGTSTWNSTELAAGYTDISNADSRPIIVNVSGTGIEEIGDYNTTVEFEIAIGFLGLYNDVCPPTSKDTLNYYIHTRYNNKSSTGAQPPTNEVSFSANSYPEEVNLTGLYNNRTDTSLAELYFDSHSTNTYSAGTKYLQLDDSDGIYYSSYTDVANRLNVRSPFWHWSDLQVLVVPHSVTSDNLHTYYRNISNNSNYSWFQGIQYDFTNTLFNDSYDVIGNALVFVRDITSDGYYIYIPHIVYRGTMNEWKLLSGSTDWVFGNALNLVTVHCMDGNLVY